MGKCYVFFKERQIFKEEAYKNCLTCIMVKGSGFLSGNSKNYSRDDGCIGNRKVRYEREMQLVRRLQ